MEKVNSNDISFSVKLTHELGDNEIVELSDLYNKVFKNYIKTLRNHEDFMKKFTSNTKKYSFHGLMKKNNSNEIIKENTNENIEENIIVYPNPVRKTININKNVDITIYNIEYILIISPV